MSLSTQVANILEQHAKYHGPQYSTFNGVQNAPDAKLYHRALNMFDAFTYVLRTLDIDVQYPASPQKTSPSLSTTSSQPFRFLDLPQEIRLMIYELLIASDQPIQIDCDHANMRPRSENLKVYGGYNYIGWNRCTCYHASGSTRERRHRSTFVSHDLQTDKQQIATEEHICIRETVLIEARARRMQDARLIRTCRQIYDEARSVLYLRNTFEFLCLAAFATYFGLQAPDQVHISRSTERHRLRAIQAMTKVKVRIAGSNLYPTFLSTSRLIRAGLGCLTNITSFELCLGNLDIIEAQPELMMIDDSMFSKPPSLRKLVVGVRKSDLYLDGPQTEQDQLDIAKELVRRILKQKDFSDTVELFRRLKNTPAPKYSVSKI